MNTHLQRAYTFLHGAVSFLWKGISEIYAAALQNKIISLGIITVIVAGGIGISYLFPSEPEKVADDRREVSVIRVSDIEGSEPLTLVGSVRSISEAKVAPNASGAITRLYGALGDYVEAGSVIAEIKNDRERASLAQAKASLEKVRNSTESSEINLSSTKDSLASAESSSRSAISSAYAIIGDAVNRKADSMFSNPSSLTPTLNATISNLQFKINAEKGRLEMGGILSRQKSAGKTPEEYSAILAELSTLSGETNKVRIFLEDVVSALNTAIPNTPITEAIITTYRSDTNIALSNINALSSSLTGTIDNLKARKSAVSSSEQNLSVGTSGVTADVRVAEAAVAAAVAQLEQTIIRAPISGTINKLDLEIGSFVSPGLPVIYITNPRGLEVSAFVSGRDIRDISLGAKAIIAGTVEGTVVRVANALDPATQKAEVKIAISANAPLVSGQSATVAINRSTKTTVSNKNGYSIPIAALKITTEGPVVFTVSENNTLISNPVVLGNLRGSSVQIESGITGEMKIVMDARGHKEGDLVIIKPVRESTNDIKLNILNGGTLYALGSKAFSNGIK